MELKAQDYIDLGFRRKYREFNRTSNPIPWIVIGLLFLGVTLYMIGSVPKSQEDTVYQSPNGQEIVLSDNGHVIVAADDTVFLLKENNTQYGNTDAILITGIVIMLATLMGSAFYLMWAADKCSEEGMKLVEQEFNKTA